MGFFNKTKTAKAVRKPHTPTPGVRGMVFEKTRDGTTHVVEAPSKTRLSTKLVNKGIAEGWIRGLGEEVVTRPAGTADNPWGATRNAPNPHLFRHFEKLVVGDVIYKVTRQPDKYADPGDDDTPVTPAVYSSGKTRVDWFYELERLSG